jgi:hypothetical protein
MAKVVRINFWPSTHFSAASEVRCILDDGRDLPWNHVELRADPFLDWGVFYPDQAEFERRASLTGAKPLSGLDPLRPTGYSFDVAALRALYESEANPAEAAPVPAPQASGRSLADAIAEAAEADSRTPKGLREKQIKGEPWHSDEDADYVIFGDH